MIQIYCHLQMPVFMFKKQEWFYIQKIRVVYQILNDSVLPAVLALQLWKKNRALPTDLTKHFNFAVKKCWREETAVSLEQIVEIFFKKQVRMAMIMAFTWQLASSHSSWIHNSAVRASARLCLFQKALWLLLFVGIMRITCKAMPFLGGTVYTPLCWGNCNRRQLIPMDSSSWSRSSLSGAAAAVAADTCTAASSLHDALHNPMTGLRWGQGWWCRLSFRWYCWGPLPATACQYAVHNTHTNSNKDTYHQSSCSCTCLCSSSCLLGFYTWIRALWSMDCIYTILDVMNCINQ